MQTAGARALREDDNGMSREAVLLQWERKIEAAERRDSDRAVVSLHPAGEQVAEEAPDEAGAPAAKPRRFERTHPPAPASSPSPERRTITIRGEPTPARRRPPVLEAQLAQPDRIALWAFLLGLVLVAVAAGTAHA
jgi:hypothetical protein